MTQDAAFGQAATFNTDVGFSLAVSPDKKAFTATFGGLEVTIEGTSAAPIATRVFSFSVPLSGTDPGQGTAGAGRHTNRSVPHRALARRTPGLPSFC